MNSSPYPIRKDWTSDMQLHARELLCPPMSSNHPQRNEAFHSCTNVGEMSSRASQTGEENDTNRTDHCSSTDKFRETLWTKELTETLNNISRECLDRLTKLENENKELRKQYRVLEAQIKPLVKSLHVHEPVCTQSQHPENGKTFIYGTGHTGQNFDSQIRQLISVLVHTNIAQNDIREDCRYLKHRISNLELENSKLSSMVREHYPHSEHHESVMQQSNVPENCNRIARNRVTNLIDPTGKGMHLAYLSPVRHQKSNFDDSTSEADISTAIRSECCLLHPYSCTDQVQGISTDQAQLEDQSKALVQRGSPILSRGLRRHSAQLFESVNHVNPFWFGNKPIETDRQFFEAVVKPAIEGSLLRASSTPAIPIPDQASAQYSFFPTEGDPYTVLAVSPTIKSSEYLLDSNQPEQNESSYLPSLPALTTRGKIITKEKHFNSTPLRPDVREYPLPVHDRNNSNLIPHGWLQLPVLPKAGLQRNPVGTRSHIILGARSIPLYLNASAEDLATKSQFSRDLDPSYSGLPNSPLARRQTRAYSTHLRPIEEVDSNLQSVYEMVTSSSRNCVSKNNNSMSRDGMAQDNELLSTSGEMSPLENLRRVLYRDPKIRYLHPLKATQKTKPPFRPMSIKTTTRQSSDLETLLYHQDQLHKCREAQRTLRYGVFSDTELLTGKFTITSRDDSAIESGEDEEDEDVQSSRESMRRLPMNEAIFVENEYQVAPSANLTQQAAKKEESSGIVHNYGATNDGSVQMQCCAEQPSARITEDHAEVESITQPAIDEESEAVDIIHLKVPGSTFSHQSKTDAGSRSTIAPPPVVIYRRRFGLPDSMENVSTIPGDEIHGLNKIEEKTVSLNPAGQSSPDHQSSDTDSVVFSSMSPGSDVESTDQSKNTNNPMTHSNISPARGKSSEGSDETLAHRTLDPHQKGAAQRIFGSPRSSEVQIIRFPVASPSTVPSGTKAANEKHKSIFEELQTVGELDYEKTRELQEETDLIQETTATHKVNGSYCSTTEKTYSKINKLYPTSMGPGKDRTGTPSRVKQTPGAEANSPSYIDRVGGSGVRKPSFIPSNPVAKCSRSFPNSPEQGLHASSKYRIHVASSVVKFGKPQSSLPKADSTNTYGNPKSMTVDTSRKPAHKYVTNYSPETKNRSRCLPNDRVSTYDSLRSPKSILSPPPIPPRTSSRTHGFQTKSISTMNSTQNDYHVSHNNSLSPVTRTTQRSDLIPPLPEMTRYKEQPTWSQSPSPVTTPKQSLRSNQVGRLSRKKVRISDDSCRETGAKETVPGSPSSNFGYSHRLAAGVLDCSHNELAQRTTHMRGNDFTSEQRQSCATGGTFNGYDSRIRGVLHPEVLYGTSNGRLPHSPQLELYHKGAFCSNNPGNKPLASTCHSGATSRWLPSEETYEQYSQADSHTPQKVWLAFRPTNTGQVSHHTTKPVFNAGAYSHENIR